MLWMLLFGNDDERAKQTKATTHVTAQSTASAQQALPVPWPMVCKFIVRVIDGPADTAIVVAKRDCPKR